MLNIVGSTEHCSRLFNQTVCFSQKVKGLKLAVVSATEFLFSPRAHARRSRAIHRVFGGDS